jgi:hypothetical protein
MLKGYGFQLQNNEPKNHGWIVSYMNGPRRIWTHNTLPGVVCSHIETIKGEFSSERSLRAHIYKPLKQAQVSVKTHCTTNSNIQVALYLAMENDH